MDNFSRYILDYYVADRIDGSLRMESLRRAYVYALTVTPNLDVNLIVDGGSKNVNKFVDSFLQQSDITRQVALRDITFSNSMVVAANKSLKYRYLFPKQIENLEQLQKVLKNAVEEYNCIKPHASLHGYTPSELYHEMPLQTELFTTLLQQAREQRIALHQRRACGHC